jgi:hypothetical protein
MMTDFTTALSNHFGVNRSIARSETAAIIWMIQGALFHCVNLKGVRFRREEPFKRPDGLAFFVFDTTVGPVVTDNRLAALNRFSIRFALPLPPQQHDRSNPTEPPPDGMSGDTPPAFPTIEQEFASANIATWEMITSIPAPTLTTANANRNHHEEDTNPMPSLPVSTSVPGTFTSLSPKMARILTCDSTGTLPTNLGSLSFLDDQPEHFQ